MAVEAIHETPARVDPLIEEPPEIGLHYEEMDYPAHIRTWNRFLHLSKWFVAHLVCVAIALYFFLVASIHLMGVVMLFVAACVLVYGVITTARIGPEPQGDLDDRIVPSVPDRSLA
jgi:hypothetical protein